MSYLREYIRIILLEQLKDSFQGKKMIFMAGAPGSGKSTVLNQLGLLEQFSIINPDDWYEPFLKEAGISLDIASFTQEYFDIVSALEAGKEQGLDVSELEKKRAELRPTMSTNAKLFNTARKQAKQKAAHLSAEGKDFIIDGTGGSYREISKLNSVYLQMGYDTAMVYVSVPKDISLERNFQRGEKGKRRLHDKAVSRSWESVNRNKELYEELFGSNFLFVDNSGTYEDYQERIELIRPAMENFLR